MFRKLSNRLTLSHILPSLIMIPLMGIALIYVLETRTLLPEVNKELLGSARLIARIANNEPKVWTDSAAAQDLVNQVSEDLNARLMLIKPDGTLLASNEAIDASTLKTELTDPDLNDLQNGIPVNYTYYSRTLNGNAVDVLYPVTLSGQGVVGIIRLTHRYDTLYEQFLNTRYYITAILFIGLVAGAGLGFILAKDIGTPIKNVTQALYEMVHGGHTEPLPEKGPDELRTLSHGINTLMSRNQHLEQARRRLLANLVHEIGRSLGALRPAIKALMKGAAEDPTLRDELLAGIDRQMDILERLLNDLAMSHEQVVGTMELDRQPIDLNEWLKVILRPWEEAATEKHIAWETSPLSGLPNIQADPIRLDQIIGNLVSNAIKFTPPGGKISLSAGVKDGRVWMSIRDSGPGIPREEQEKLFTPFFRGRFSKRFSKGMGLGLSIAHDLAVAHGGSIEIDSQPGTGTTFTLWIPADHSILTNLPERMVKLQN